MKQNFIVIFVFIINLFSVVGIVQSQEIQNYDIIKSVNSFSMNLYHQLSNDSSGNLFFSPYSIATILIMDIEGSREETAIEIGQALHFPLSLKKKAPAQKENPWNLKPIHKVVSTLNKEFSSSLSCKIVNALFFAEMYSINSSYLDTIRKYYGENSIFKMDFKNNLITCDKINQWVNNQTNGHIEQLLPPSLIDDTTVLILANAIYFRGDWVTPFNNLFTSEKEFTMENGNKIYTPIMEGSEIKAKYAAFNSDGSLFNTPKTIKSEQKSSREGLYPDENGFAILELFYKKSSFSMLIIVPYKYNGLQQLQKILTTENLDIWTSRMEEREVDVNLPRFKYAVDYKMQDTLKMMGIKRAFNRPDKTDGAQFNGITNSMNSLMQPYISMILHKAFIEVNERGSEAAAITLDFKVTLTSAPETIPFIPNFNADIPFIFFIRDIKTNLILFAGRLSKPG